MKKTEMDKSAIMEMLEELPAEYVNKVRIYAATLLQIFRERTKYTREP